MNKTKFMSFLLFAATAFALPGVLSAHELGSISEHSPGEPNLYVGYGPVWNGAAAGWNQARINAFNACTADGHDTCIMSVAAWDHCTFWGEGEWQHEGERGDPGFTPRYICLSHPLVADSDGDGVPDDIDQCPNTDLDGPVTVGGLETGVANTFFEETGCAVSDLVNTIVEDCSIGARNKGQFLSCFTRGTNGLVATGIISGRDKGTLQNTAAKSDLPE